MHDPEALRDAAQNGSLAEADGRLDRFPDAVIYKMTAQRVYVRAVAHGRRRPGYWDK